MIVSTRITTESVVNLSFENYKENNNVCFTYVEVTHSRRVQ